MPLQSLVNIIYGNVSTHPLALHIHGPRFTTPVKGIYKLKLGIKSPPPKKGNKWSKSSYSLSTLIILTLRFWALQILSPFYLVILVFAILGSGQIKKTEKEYCDETKMKSSKQKYNWYYLVYFKPCYEIPTWLIVWLSK